VGRAQNQGNRRKTTLALVKSIRPQGDMQMAANQ
jgi:hypothetical protein